MSSSLSTASKELCISFFTFSLKQYATPTANDVNRGTAPTFTASSVSCSVKIMMPGCHKDMQIGDKLPAAHTATPSTMPTSLQAALAQLTAPKSILCAAGPGAEHTTATTQQCSVCLLRSQGGLNASPVFCAPASALPHTLQQCNISPEFTSAHHMACNCSGQFNTQTTFPALNVSRYLRLPMAVSHSACSP